MTVQNHASARYWRPAFLGGVGGAALALAVTYIVASVGLLPGTGDAHIREYLLAHPALFEEMAEKYQAQQDTDDEKLRQKAVDKLGLKTFFDPKVAFVTGPSNAKSTFVEFFDYNCPHCRNSVKAVQHFYDLHKNDTRFAFIEFPFLGPQSILASRAALAARKQPDKYLALHFALMTEEEPVDEKLLFADAEKVGLDIPKLKADMNDPAIAKQIAAAAALAHNARIEGTPEFIVDGVSRNGEVDDETLGQMAAGS